MSKSPLFRIAASVLAVSLGEMVQSQPTADRIIGIYQSSKKDGKITIYKKGNAYFGKSVWANASGNVKPAQSVGCRESVGKILFSDFIYRDDAYLGKFIDPRSGNAFRCKITTDGNLLKIRVYVGISLFGKTECFERITVKN